MEDTILWGKRCLPGKASETKLRYTQTVCSRIQQGKATAHGTFLQRRGSMCRIRNTMHQPPTAKQQGTEAQRTRKKAFAPVMKVSMVVKYLYNIHRSYLKTSCTLLAFGP